MASEREDWRPIETAPKDGTEFLCWWKPIQGDGEVVRARWNNDPPWIGFYGLNVSGMNGRSSISDLSGGWPETKLLATHWMPLPDPPTNRT